MILYFLYALRIEDKEINPTKSLAMKGLTHCDTKSPNLKANP